MTSFYPNVTLLSLQTEDQSDSVPHHCINTLRKENTIDKPHRLKEGQQYSYRNGKEVTQKTFRLENWLFTPKLHFPRL